MNSRVSGKRAIYKTGFANTRMVPGVKKKKNYTSSCGVIQNYSSDKARLWLIETREVHGCSRSYNQQDLAGSNQTSLVPEELQLAHRMVNQWRTRTQSDAASRSYHSDWNKVWLRRWCFCNYLNQRTYSHTTQVLVKVSSIHFVKWWCCVMFNTATSGRRYPNLSNHHQYHYKYGLPSSNFHFHFQSKKFVRNFEAEQVSSRTKCHVQP